MTPGYAVTAENDDAPTAVFVTLDDALSWAALRFGRGGFHIAPVLTEVVLPPRQAHPSG